MRLSISNIAWDPCEDETIATLLNSFGIDAIDVAPSKYFPDPAIVTSNEIAFVKNWWFERGIEIVGMQSLLFGTVGLNVFGNLETQSLMLRHLDAICRVGAGLGANNLVFGSPKNRDRFGLSDLAASDIATLFFRRLGDIAERHGVVICLEPNPTCYGGNFMIDSTETARIVEKVDHPAIRMQLDTGSLVINNEDIFEVLMKYTQLIGHVHVSEPYLRPIGDGKTDHRLLASAINKYLHNQLVTIEMLATQEQIHQVSIERALNNAVLNYRNSRQNYS